MTPDHLHPLDNPAPKPRRFTFPFCYEPHPLAVAAAREVQQYLASEPAWQDELSRGKMFGVLVVETPDGRTAFLAAYSGLLAGRNDWDYFVPPVFDLLSPGCHFQTEEKAITDINTRIRTLEESPRYTALREAAARADADARARLEAFRQEMRDEKARLSGDALISRSQFLNAELRRLKKRLAAESAGSHAELEQFETLLSELKNERRRRSERLQLWLFAQFRMLDARGEERDLCDIFSHTPQRIPPAGAGECCAPKLLQYAYRNGLKPVCMAEFWWGRSPKNEVRHHLHYYPACRGKCLPILTHMLQGLDVDPDPQAADSRQQLKVVYSDDALCVVEKPSGMLSVPGKSGRRSVLSEVKRLYPDAEGPMMVHRLDQDTSGLMVVAKTTAAYIALQRQFAARTVKKRYEAILSRRPQTVAEGTVSLPLRPDPLDRPRQVADRLHGKPAVTRYHIYTDAAGTVRARLEPLTGRTHQLRLHCAHAEGLGAPIAGDPLYGRAAGRLCLHAALLSFVHPVTGRRMTFTAGVPF